MDSIPTQRQHLANGWRSGWSPEGSIQNGWESTLKAICDFSRRQFPGASHVVGAHLTSVDTMSESRNEES